MIRVVIRKKSFLADVLSCAVPLICNPKPFGTYPLWILKFFRLWRMAEPTHMRLACDTWNVPRGFFLVMRIFILGHVLGCVWYWTVDQAAPQAGGASGGRGIRPDSFIEREVASMVSGMEAFREYSSSHWEDEYSRKASGEKKTAGDGSKERNEDAGPAPERGRRILLTAGGTPPAESETQEISALPYGTTEDYLGIRRKKWRRRLTPASSSPPPPGRARHFVNLFDLYCFSLQHGMIMFLGRMNSPGVSGLENLLFAIVAPLGIIIQSIIFSKINMIFTAQGQHQVRQQQLLMDLRSSMKMLRIPDELRIRILAFFTYSRYEEPIKLCWGDCSWAVGPVPQLVFTWC